MTMTKRNFDPADPDDEIRARSEDFEAIARESREAARRAAEYERIQQFERARREGTQNQ